MKINLPATIKIAAVITSSPRWVIALLAAEGFNLPPEWHGWWVIASAFLNLGMAIVEGFAFAYILTAWRNQKDKGSDRLFWMALFSASVFVGVMFPSISAGVRGVSLSELLTNDWTLHAWSVAVAMSTITIVAGVGYAEKQTENNESELVKKHKEELKAEKEKVKTAESKLKESEESHNRQLNAVNIQLSQSELERERLTKQMGNMAGLFSEVKKEQILAINGRWPNLSNTTISEMVGTTPSHVSTTLKSKENGTEVHVNSA